MSSARDDIKAMSEELSNLISQRDEMFRKSRVLEDEMSAKIQAAIEEEQLLSYSTWTMSIDENRCSLRTEWPQQLQELSKIFDINIHCHITLCDDTYLYFDDDEISIRVGDVSRLKSIISQFKLKIVLEDGIAEKVARLLEKVEIINHWKQVLEYSLEENGPA